MQGIIKNLELKLLQPAIRSDREEIAALLADDFVEISQKGSVYDKTEILHHLPLEKEERKFKTSDWQIVEMSSGLVRVNYISSESEDRYKQKVRRTSIWRQNHTQGINKAEDRWQMIFHQGTRILSEER